MRAYIENDSPSGRGACLPVALAAVTVAGQCRERSPVDLAIFGDAGEKFSDRFVDPLTAQSLLADAVAEGNAEGRGLLRTSAGTRPFRISLWRQRGGDRVRLLAAFAAEPMPQAPPPEAASQPVVARIGHDLRAPVGSIISLADAMRANPDAFAAEALADRAADIAAASWRIMRLAEDLAALAAGAPGAPRLREIDPQRLLGRALRLAAPMALDMGAVLDPMPQAPEAAAVLAEEDALSGVIDDLIRRSLRAAGPGGRVSTGVSRAASGGIDIRIEGTPGGPAAELPGVARGGLVDLPVRAASELRRIVGASGAGLELSDDEERESRAIIRFPPARCFPLS